MLTDVVMDVAGGLPQCTLVTHLFLWPSLQSATLKVRTALLTIAFGHPS